MCVAVNRSDAAAACRSSTPASTSTPTRRPRLGSTPFSRQPPSCCEIRGCDRGAASERGMRENV
eukprot:354028-Chlamydomonas_euryale.AAC.10